MQKNQWFNNKNQISLVERRSKIFHYLEKSWAKQSKIRNVLEDGKEFTSQKKAAKILLAFLKIYYLKKIKSFERETD